MPLPPARTDTYTHPARNSCVWLVMLRAPIEQFDRLRSRVGSALPEPTLPDVFGASTRQYCHHRRDAGPQRPALRCVAGANHVAESTQASDLPDICGACRMDHRFAQELGP